MSEEGIPNSDPKAYKAALKVGNRKGWGVVPNDSVALTAAQAQFLGIKWCLNPAAIFNWAVKYNIPIWNMARQLHSDDNWAWEYFMNDKPMPVPEVAHEKYQP